MLVVVIAVATGICVLRDSPVYANGCVLWNNTTSRYEIDDEADLDTLRSSLTCLDVTLVQTDDIDLSDLSGSTWVPINNFAGTYDGNGKSITGLLLSGSNAGLFNTTTAATTFKNLTVVVDPASVAVDNVGSIIGEALGPVTIENLSVDVNFAAGNFVGGLIGLARDNVMISETSVIGEISATFSVGGMVGRSEMGDDNTITVQDSQAAIDVTISGSFAGGIFGVGVDTDLRITGSSAEVDITSGASAGGWAGGLAGAARDVEITNSSASGEVHAGNMGYAGGLVAFPFGDSEVSNSYWNGNVSDGSFGSGGFFSYGNGVTIVNSYCLGEITSATGQAAGFVPEVVTELTVIRSFSSCDTEARTSGGFFTRAYGDVSITNSYSSGVLSGSTYAAGFGVWTDGGFTLTNSFASSSLEGAGSKNKFVVDYAIPPLIRNSFCFGSNCDTEYAVATEDLKQINFLVRRTWDFTNIWCIRDSLNDGFPVLRAIDFGPGDTGCRPRRSRAALQSLTLDPAGGVCGSQSSPWTQTFRRSFTLPTATDCRRDGYAFLGWTQDPSLTAPENLLTSTVARSGAVTAVWGALPAAPSRLDVIANFLCNRNCTSVIVVWPTSTNPTDTTQITIDNSEAVCSLSGQVVELGWCWITGLTAGSTHTATVAWRNQHGTGPTTTGSFTLA